MKGKIYLGQDKKEYHITFFHFVSSILMYKRTTSFTRWPCRAGAANSCSAFHGLTTLDI